MNCTQAEIHQLHWMKYWNCYFSIQRNFLIVGPETMETSSFVLCFFLLILFVQISSFPFLVNFVLAFLATIGGVFYTVTNTCLLPLEKILMYFYKNKGKWWCLCFSLSRVIRKKFCEKVSWQILPTCSGDQLSLCANHALHRYWFLLETCAQAFVVESLLDSAEDFYVF